jgi:hypothetical protein
MKNRTDDTGMRDEYDFSGAARGKYAKRFAEGTNVVVLRSASSEHVRRGA